MRRSFNAVYETSFFAGRDLAYFLLFQLQGDSRCDQLRSAEMKKMKTTKRKKSFYMMYSRYKLFPNTYLIMI